MISKKKVAKKTAKKAVKKSAIKFTVPVLYEDEDILVFNKPAGLMVHGDGRNDANTLADYIGKTYKKIKGVGEPFVMEVKGKKISYDRPGIVHRLDQDTTGVLVIAKTGEAFRKLKAQFKNREVKKVYRALLYGNVKQDTGIIDAPIGRSKKDFRSRSVPDPFEEDTRGTLRDAVTKYKVLARYTLLSTDGNGATHREPITYVEVFPETGRTHQIRVHFKSIRHPIVGDTLYGPEKKEQLIKRTALHAYQLTLLSPSTRKPIVVKAELPKDFKGALAKLQIL